MKKVKSPLIVKIDKHITLRIRNTKEAAELFELVNINRKHLRAWLPWVDANKTVADSRKFISLQLKKFNNVESCDFGIYFDEKLVGSGGYNKIKKSTRMGEIGYWIGKDFEGNGIITRAVSAMIDVGKKKYKLHRIEIKVDPKNKRSQAIPKRLGFKYEGTLRDAAITNRKFHDLELWSLLV